MAVYTEVSNDDLERFVAEYDIGQVTSIKGIAEGVENSNYLMQTETGTFILTIYEKRVKPQDLPFFLGLMDHLAAAGIPCPTPIHGKDGQALRQVSGKPAAIVSFLDGVWPKGRTPSHCAELGEAVARMHVAGSGFEMRRPNDLRVKAWRPLFDSCRDGAEQVMPGLETEIAAELDHLEKMWPTDLPEGVIHADLFPDNVFFLGGKLSGIIDFYFACNDCFAYEIAICLNAWCFEPDHQFNVTKAKHLLSAYRRVRPFSDAELAVLPLLARGAAMRFLLTRLYDWLNRVDGALVRPKDPLEYFTKLKFHQGVTRPSAYGLD
ncbi:MAG: homoserine kinase [Alphaproteobacteria bacterium]|nr:homoserine kinase [Alphaproteobacteria bacterium]|tara:strand:+ start:1801 stop:2763 length:963 start_codon:yes stop_codon:yes gene_type:complete